MRKNKTTAIKAKSKAVSDTPKDQNKTLVVDRPSDGRTTKDAISDISNDLQSLLYDILPEIKSGEEQATSIPYLYNMLGDFITNPSTVSVSTFRRMCSTDPAIGSALDYEAALIASTIGPFSHVNPEIQEMVRWQLMNLGGGGFRELVKNMLSAEWAAYFLGEMAETQKDGFYRIKHVTPIPPITTLFAVDNNGRIKEENGIFQYIINTYAPGFQSFNVAGGQFSPVGAGPTPLEVDPFADGGDYDYPIRQPYANLFGIQPLRTEMMIYFKFNSILDLGNPYGNSRLRRIYSLYVLKYGVLQFLSQVLYKKSMPLLVVKYDGTMQTQTPDGQNSQPLAYSVRQAMFDANGNSFVMFPTINGVEIEPVKIEGDLTIFKDILEYIDRSIYMGIGTPPTLSNQDGGSHSGNYMQDSIHNKLVQDKRDDLTDCLLRTIVKKIIDNNFIYGKDFTDYGSFESKSLSLDDKLKLSAMFEQNTRSGIANVAIEDDLEKMREVLGYETADEITKKISSMNKEVFEKQLEGNQGQPGRSLNQRPVKDSTEKPFSHWE